MLKVLLAAVLFAISILSSGAPARAQDAYPAKPVRMIVPFPPGGPADLIARVMAQKLSEDLGKQFYIENQAGAGGNLGMTNAARSTADGYTILFVSSSFVVNPSLYARKPYDPFKDFTPVTLAAKSPDILVVNESFPAKTVQEFVALAKANPGKYSYAVPGIGTTPHLAGEVLKLRTGIQMQHIPFLGAGPAVQAILAGTVQVLVASQGGSVEAARASGQTLALAQTGAERSPDLPQVPTLGELGVADAVSETFNALYAPAGTPAPIVERLAAAVLAVLARPDVTQRYRTAGVPVVPEGADGLKARVAREVPLWREVIRQAKIAVE